MAMKDEILANLNRFDNGKEEWCLPPMFWLRAEEMTGYAVFPFGNHFELPVRYCHTTSIFIVEGGKKIGIPVEYCTGYACSNGIWCRHSWVINDEEKTLLEPTPNRYDKYYGVVLDGVEFEEFKEMMEWKKPELVVKDFSIPMEQHTKSNYTV